MSYPSSSDLRIPTIMARQRCEKHEAGFDQPCFRVPKAFVDDEYYRGVCNTRAKLAGYNAPVSALSLSVRSPENLAGGGLIRRLASRRNKD